jgi:hypothetical protein
MAKLPPPKVYQPKTEPGLYVERSERDPENLPNPARPSRSIKAILRNEEAPGPLDTTGTR